MKNYALIRNNIVENIIVFDEPTEELLEEFRILHGADFLIEADASAGIGGEYDGKKIWPPRPFPSWVKNEETGMWNAPIPYPTDDKVYSWNETDLMWVALQ